MAERPTPRPALQPQSGYVPARVSAQRVDTGAARPSDGGLSGLLRGLSSLNPALNQFHQDAFEDKAREYAQRGAAEAQQAGTDVVAQPGTAEPPLDADASPLGGAFASIRREAFRAGIAARAADGAKQAALTAYNEQKDLPDFDLNKFLAEHRQSNMAGLPNDMAGSMGKHLGQFEAAIRQDYEGVRLKRLDETRESNISAILRNTLTLDEPGAIARRYRTEVLPQIEGNGKSKREGATYLLRHLIALSDKAGGKPELFASLYEDKDEHGKTILDYNSALLPAVEAAKDNAQRQVDKAVETSLQEGNARWLKETDERAARNPSSVTFEELLAKLGPHGVFKTDNDVVSYWRRLQAQKVDSTGTDLLLRQATLGQLYLSSKEDQGKIMSHLTQGVVQGMSRAIADNNMDGISALADALVQAHNTAGSTVPSASVKGMLEFFGGTTIPKPGTPPPPAFQAAAELYRRLASAPQLRDRYFDEKASKVMESYVGALANGAEPTAAYAPAYDVVSPEAERRAEAFKQTPAYKDKLSKVTGLVTGTSFWTFLPFIDEASNGGQITADAREHAIQLVQRNPQITDEQVLKNTQEWVKRSYALDEATGVAIKVPDSIDATLMQKALSAYTKKVSSDLKLDQRDAGWSLSVVPVNLAQGTYRVSTAFNGAPVHPVADLNVKTMVDDYRKATLWSPEDAAALHSMSAAIDAGQPVNADQYVTQIAKARQLGVAGALVQKLEAHELGRVRSILASRLQLGGTPDQSKLMPKDDRPIKVNHQLTTQVAQRFLDGSQGGSTGLAASLVTLGEALVLKAYGDPAKDAGMNIGAGYNLKANAHKAVADLRAARVPEDMIRDVIEGKASLSPEQAERLTLVAVGRYERTAMEQVNEVQPRLWERLQPQQRAVLVDIAYQTGDVGQFRKALASLASGDEAAFREQSKVTYVNRKGVRVVDERRNELRNAMLAGTAMWQSVLQRHSAIPTPLQALALNQ